MGDSYHETLCNWAQTDSRKDQKLEEESSMDISHWEPDDVWDAKHKQAAVRIFRREMRGRFSHCTAELRNIIIEGIKKAKNIDDYITIPGELNKIFR